MKSTHKDYFYSFEQDKEAKEKLDNFLQGKEYIRPFIEELIQKIDIPQIKEILELIYKIVELAGYKDYEKGYKAGFDIVPIQYKADKMNFIVDTSNAYRDSYYYKPTCKREDIKNLLKCGLCCGVCRYYKYGLCQNPMYSEFRMPDVEPYQICECVKFDGRKYRGYYFDGEKYRGHQSSKKQEHKQHFSEVSERTIDMLQGELSEKENFERFFESEIPEVYAKLKREFKKRKEIVE